MDDLHRKKILENMNSLVEGISFDELFGKLKSKGMFNSYMENEILNEEDTKKLKFLYWYVTTRGPEAFKNLCEALKETNHNNLVELLTSNRPNTVNAWLNGNSSSELNIEEQYPFEEEWTVIKGDPINHIMDYDREKVYKMRSSPRGLALIINIYKYVNDTQEEREGSEKDVARLKSILPQLGFEVTVEEDLTGDEIEEKVHEFAKNEKHWKCDTAMVIFMGHGKQTTDNSRAVIFTGSDSSRCIYAQDLVDELSGRKCEALRGKPKIFFFQTCRGDNINFPVRVSNGTAVREEEELNILNGHTMHRQEGHTDTSLHTDGRMVGKTSMVRSDADIFIGYATSSGMLSMRDPETGSWYIQTLCRVLAKHAWHEDLHSMLQTVMQERDKLGHTEELIIKELNQGFNKLLYFQPGIFESAQAIKLLNGS